ncbi:hypothetical protein MCOR27_010962 [Pyricularia oryzae]|uniref:Uncharacterized protein n=1 Tax=Pyricularia grisea TaxID=148305 RepID=A0ABQ8NZ88_PYRGI|nr:hypothetical protein MCOR01_001393 [Pyricularia oryzae]KAI6304274.1 hypothetical protein MCOR33_000789 [Pyricularia grisea]KAH9430062.1 hypothetical protein MCOR02_009784 [Pyricularia oryzae]KAI6257044.1 hypothetical protein MCOR19_006553 [Pyricularia oryzae]KAI6266600.1 hypothetical protein MCOR27_010962 [Pyricularia oryzae]
MIPFSSVRSALNQGREATAAQYLPSDLVFKANKGISLARRVCLELRSIRLANVPFISPTSLEGRLDTILACIEGPPDTPYEKGNPGSVSESPKKTQPRLQALDFRPASSTQTSIVPTVFAPITSHGGWTQT